MLSTRSGSCVDSFFGSGKFSAMKMYGLGQAIYGHSVFNPVLSNVFTNKTGKILFAMRKT